MEVLNAFRATVFIVWEARNFVMEFREKGREGQREGAVPNG